MKNLIFSLFMLCGSIILLIVISCEQNQSFSATEVPFESNISDCKSLLTKSMKIPSDSEECNEDIIWNYDFEHKKLTILNDDILLNCCGDHEIKAMLEDNTYVITEIDNPQNGSERCKCMCRFDFETTLENIEDEMINIRLQRFIKENDQTDIIFEGTLSLSESSDTILVQRRTDCMF